MIQTRSRQVLYSYYKGDHEIKTLFVYLGSVEHFVGQAFQSFFLIQTRSAIELLNKAF